MSKMILAINKMIENKEKINNVIKRQNEFFFLYDLKHKWSIYPDSIESAHYYLVYYRDDRTLEQLSRLEGQDFEFIEMISYSTKELKSIEAIESFQELYRTVKEKLYNIDDVLDDIIKDDDEVPF